MNPLLLGDNTPAPSYDKSFMTGVLPDGLTYTNSSTTRWFYGSNGLLQTAAANVPIFEYDPVTLVLRGMRWEMEARTNLALWNRDLTNAAWAKTGGTAALNQTGLDGVANSASSFTATAANGTCLQSITSASAARVTSFYLKRITGTGQVDITQDNGVTWTTVALTSAWQRFQVTATAANPILGIRVVVSGDAVGLDYAQHETPAREASSPIATTTAAVTRAADVLTGTITPWYRQSEGTIVFEGIASHILNPFDGARGPFLLSDGTYTNSIGFYFIETGASVMVVNTGGVQQVGMGALPAVTAGAVHRVALAYKVNNFGISPNGGDVVTDTVGTVPTVTTLQLGKAHPDGVFFMGYGRRFTYYPNRLGDSTIKGQSRV